MGGKLLARSYLWFYSNDTSEHLDLICCSGTMNRKFLLGVYICVCKLKRLKLAKLRLRHDPTGFSYLQASTSQCEAAPKKSSYRLRSYTQNKTKECETILKRVVQRDCWPNMQESDVLGTTWQSFLYCRYELDKMHVYNKRLSIGFGCFCSKLYFKKCPGSRSHASFWHDHRM